MFNNIGKKIQTLAKVVCWIGIVASVIAGLVMCASDGDMVPFGLLTMIVGTIASWIGSFFVYGFGELIVKVTEIADNTRPGAASVAYIGNAPTGNVPPMENNNVNHLPPQN